MAECTSSDEPESESDRAGVNHVEFCNAASFESPLHTGFYELDVTQPIPEIKVVLDKPTVTQAIVLAPEPIQVETSLKSIETHQEQGSSGEIIKGAQLDLFSGLEVTRAGPRVGMSGVVERGRPKSENDQYYVETFHAPKRSPDKPETDIATRAPGRGLRKPEKYYWAIEYDEEDDFEDWGEQSDEDDNSEQDYVDESKAIISRCVCRNCALDSDWVREGEDDETLDPYDERATDDLSVDDSTFEEECGDSDEDDSEETYDFSSGGHMESVEDCSEEAFEFSEKPDEESCVGEDDSEETVDSSAYGYEDSDDEDDEATGDFSEDEHEEPGEETDEDDEVTDEGRF